MKKRLIPVLFSFVPFLIGCNNGGSNKKEEPSYKLVTPVISLCNDKITWDKVEHADYYAIYESDTVYKCVTENYLNLNITINGDYEFSVQAISLGLTYENSGISNKVLYSINLIELEEPTIYLQENFIYWEYVENASNYGVYIENKLIEDPEFIYEQEYIKWKIALSNGGDHLISVCSFSDNSECESQSDPSNGIEVSVSSNVKWIPTEIVEKWHANYEIKVKNKQVFVDASDHIMELTSFSVVDSQRTFLNINFGKIVKSTSAPNMVLYVNEVALKEINSDDINYQISNNSTAYYNLSAFMNKVVYIRVVIKSGVSLYIDNIHYSTKDGVSLYEKWSPSNFKDDWSAFGNVSYHNEGICLESGSSTPYITNKIKVSHNKPYFAVMLRKFIRTGSQDTDPEAYLYANGAKLTPIDASTPAMTATSDAAIKYTFDLSAFINQIVEIKIESVKGQHACFTSMFFTDKGSYSVKSYWDIVLIQEEWDFKGVIEIHTEGVCLHNNGEEASIENKIKINSNALEFDISFRKFLRDDEQDKDPKIKVYINNQIIRAINATEDYVTVHDGTFHTFGYDLTPYQGQIINVRIVNVEGEHACFNQISIINGVM